MLPDKALEKFGQGDFVKGMNGKFNLVDGDQVEGQSNKQTSDGIVGITKKMGIDCQA